MNTLRKLTVVVSIMLISIVLSASSVTSDALKPAAQASLVVIDIPAVAFIPLNDSYDYSDDGLVLRMDTDAGQFAAPINIPANVYIKSIILYAYDASVLRNICAQIHRHNTAQYTYGNLGGVCTSGSSGYQAVSTWSISPQFISSHHGAYVYLVIEDPIDLSFYGVKIKYKP